MVSAELRNYNTKFTMMSHDIHIGYLFHFVYIDFREFLLEHLFFDPISSIWDKIRYHAK